MFAGRGNDTLDGGTGDDMLDGGAGNNTLAGWNGNNILRAGNGNNQFDGGNGSDTFVFSSGFGKNVITDYRAGDLIQLNGVFNNFQSVQVASIQIGADTVIGLDADHSITLIGVTAASLQPSGFSFA